MKIEYAINRFTMEAKLCSTCWISNWRSISLLRAMSHHCGYGDLAVVWQRGVRWCVDAAEFLDAGSYKHVQRWAKE